MSLQPEDMDFAELTAAVCRSLGRESVTISDWNMTPITYDATNPSSQGVYRVAGSGRHDGREETWSLVLKVVRSPEKVAVRPGYWPRLLLPEEERDSPPMFWEREPLAYQSGMLDDLPDCMAAPRCFGVVRKGTATYWLWLEDFKDAHGGRWTLTRYRTTARALGRFNGAYLAGRAVPAHSWLGRGWMRAWLDEVARQGGMARIVAAARKDPIIHRAMPSTMLDALQRLWREREMFLDALDRLPRTLCHRDLVPANILACFTTERHERLAAVDWAFVGPGPVGEDLPPLVLVPASPGANVIASAQLDEPVFGEYLEGLRDAGWHGERQLARLGYTASAALRYGCLTAAVMLQHVLDPALRTAMERRHAQSSTDLLEREAAMISLVLGLAHEARDLMQDIRV